MTTVPLWLLTVLDGAVGTFYSPLERQKSTNRKNSHGSTENVVGTGEGLRYLALSPEEPWTHIDT